MLFKPVTNSDLECNGIQARWHEVQGPVTQNFPKFLPKLKPKLTFENLKYARWIS